MPKYEICLNKGLAGYTEWNHTLEDLTERIVRLAERTGGLLNGEFHFADGSSFRIEMQSEPTNSGEK